MALSLNLEPKKSLITKRPLIANDYKIGGGRVVRWCWVNFQCRGVLLSWIRVGQGPVALAVGAGGGCLDIFSLVYHFSFLSPSLWETARYRLKYCLKGPLSPPPHTHKKKKKKRLQNKVIYKTLSRPSVIMARYTKSKLTYVSLVFLLQSDLLVYSAQIVGMNTVFELQNVLLRLLF